MTARRNAHTILVVSDLHLTDGRDPWTGRWSATEDFFWDNDFRDFLEYHSQRSHCTLVVNGDWFDFLQVLLIPTDEERAAFGIPGSDINRIYGLRCSGPSAEFQIEKIMDGHPVLFQALADFLAAGNELKVVKGNHDVHLLWPGVQERIYGRLVRLATRRHRKIRRTRVEFLPWIYYLPGLLYVEHGNQLEATCAFRNFLVPLLPFALPGERAHIELDLSSLLVRYLTNRVEPFNPLADNIRPLSDFYVMLLRKYPLFAIRTFGTAVRFVLKVIGKSQELARGPARRAMERIVQENEEQIANQAARFAGGDGKARRTLSEKLRSLYRRTPAPTLERGPWTFVWLIIKASLSGLVWLVPLYLLTFLPDVSRWIVRGVEALGVSGLSALVQMLWQLNLLHGMLGVLAVALVLKIGRMIPRSNVRKSGVDAFPDLARAMRVRADVVAQTLGVRYVTFGHTHYADTACLSNGGRYFNTGTWMGILEAREQLYRDVHQFSFLRITGAEAELLHWNPERKEPQEVVVMEMESTPGEREDGIFKTAARSFRY
jgi:UDP-2,3-diacylglucosamine pyrophosphatase LpxH